jgi:hypothetical protein
MLSPMIMLAIAEDRLAEARRIAAEQRLARSYRRPTRAERRRQARQLATPVTAASVPAASVPAAPATAARPAKSPVAPVRPAPASAAPARPAAAAERGASRTMRPQALVPLARSAEPPARPHRTTAVPMKARWSAAERHAAITGRRATVTRLPVEEARRRRAEDGHDPAAGPETPALAGSPTDRPAC